MQCDGQGGRHTQGGTERQQEGLGVRQKVTGAEKGRER